MTSDTERSSARLGLRYRDGELRRPAAARLEPVTDHAAAPPPHADDQIEASAPTLRTLFEEGAAALLRVTGGSPVSGPACRWESVSLRAPDLPTLAGAWLDRLISLGESRLGDDRREGIVSVVVDRVAAPEDDLEYGRWQLRARVGLRPYSDAIARTGLIVRTASDRPLTVEGSGEGWTLRASLSV